MTSNTAKWTWFALLLGCAVALPIGSPAHAADDEPARPGPSSAPEANTDAARDAAPDASPDATPDASPDAAADPAPGARPRTGSFQIKIA